MRNLNDLDQAWAELDARADAYPLNDLTIQSPRPSRGKRAAMIVAGVASVAAVAAFVLVVTNRSTPAASSHGQPAASSNHRTQSTAVSVAAKRPKDDGPGWTTLPTGHYLVVIDGISGASFRSVIGVGNDQTQFQPGDQYQEVQVTGPPNGLVIKVNAPGSWAPDGGQQLTFDGRDAYYGTFLRHPEIPGHPVPARVSLAWQYEPGAWATIGTLTDASPITLEDAQHYASLIKIAVGEVLPDPLPQNK